MKKIANLISLLAITLSGHLNAGNNPLTREVKLPSSASQGYYTVTSIETFEEQCVSATIVYTISEGTSDTKTTTTTISGTFTSSPEATLSFCNQTGVSSSRVQSCTLNLGWVSTATSSPTRAGTSSDEEYGAYPDPSPWYFKSWIVGPPPHDSPTGPPAKSTTMVPGTPKTKLVATSQGYNWTLRWIEEK